MLKLMKCFFMQKKVEYLRQIFSAGNLEMEDKRKDFIQAQLQPSSITDIRALLGLCNLYRRFIKVLTRIASPLTKRLKKTAAVRFTTLNV